MTGSGGEEAGVPLSEGTRLAYERTFLAYERSQLAWVRTAVAFISFGFTIAKFFEMLHEKDGTAAPVLGPRAVGVLMIAIGLGGLVLATLQHWRAAREIRKRCPGLPRSSSGPVAALLALLGILALLGALLRS